MLLSWGRGHSTIEPKETIHWNCKKSAPWPHSTRVCKRCWGEVDEKLPGPTFSCPVWQIKITKAAFCIYNSPPFPPLSWSQLLWGSGFDVPPSLMYWASKSALMPSVLSVNTLCRWAGQWKSKRGKGINHKISKVELWLLTPFSL